MLIRPATDADLDRVGELTVEAYVGDGLVPEDAEYVRDLGDAAGRLADAVLLVAEVDGAVAGTVTYAPAGSSYAEICDQGEAAFRMLAVDKAYRGRGIGAALAKECIGRALDDGASMLRLSTQEESRTAHRIYARLGFVATPERDWYPIPDKILHTFELDLRAHDDGARDLDPPRYCTVCGRRMVVQVTPTGWTATCSRHGSRHS